MTDQPSDTGDADGRPAGQDEETATASVTDDAAQPGTSQVEHQLLADGGAGAEDVTLDPWGSSTVSDYRKLFDQFGIETFDDVLESVPNPHYLMRRGVIFGHREYGAVTEAMANDEPFAALSGFMPTGDPHIGHKLVFDELVWHQEMGGEVYGLIADLEAHSARGLTWEEIDEHTRNYLLSLLALGFDAEEGDLYRQSTNRTVQDLAFELGIQTNFSELAAIYDFDGETDVSHMQSVVTQMADILYPQLEEPMPTVIPVGPDQDPHVRLARDLAARVQYFGVTRAYASFEAAPDETTLIEYAYETLVDRHPDETIRCSDAAGFLEGEREPGATDIEATTLDSTITMLKEASKEPLRPRVRFVDRNATEAAFEALIEAVEGEKRVYDAHIDAFEMDRESAEALAREVELDHGGYGFLAPSSIYHRFMTGLTGGKMSSSVAASHISLLDDPETGYDKVKSATTGGRETAEKQRELGGEADECPVYELYAYLLAGDDDEFAREVYEECVGGERLCGDCKEQAATLMREFLADHQEQRAEMEAKLEEFDFDVDVAGDRRG